MPVDAIQPYQIITMAVFLLFLVVVLFLVRRFRGKLSGHIHRSRRMRHIEDMALTGQQRLHLVEVDGQTFMIHAGKGHAATVVPVNAGSPVSEPLTLMDVQAPTKQATPTRSQAGAQAASGPAPKDRPVEAKDKPRTSADIDQIANAIAEARRRNPSLGLGK